MMDTRSQLLSRLTSCKREQLIPGVFLQALITSAESLGPEVASLVRRPISEEGRLVETYRYPVKAMLEMLDVIGQAGQDRGEIYGDALFQCGWVAGVSYVASSMGRIRALVATATGLHRALEGIPNAASQAVNFGEHSYRRLTSSSGELVFKQDLIGPAWNAGMVVGSIRKAFALEEDRLNFEVRVTDEDASSFLLRVDW
jgi:uncharacterized protein (TIGR02265 family)